MDKQDIIILWKSGVSKYNIAKFYKTDYNLRIKTIRLDKRFKPEFLSDYEALKVVENAIYEYVMRRERAC